MPHAISSRETSAMVVFFSRLCKSNDVLIVVRLYCLASQAVKLVSILTLMACISYFAGRTLL